MSVILTIIILSVVVCIHEWGHYIAAKLNGIFVEEFAIGMGPILLKKQGKETLFTLRAVPFGGFCKMLGEDGDEDGTAINNPRSYNSKKTWQRFIVLFAGAFMNFLVAFIMFLWIFSYLGFQVPVVESVVEGTPAQIVGLQADDEIISFNGKKIHSFNELFYEAQRNGENEASFVIKRDNDEIHMLTALNYNEEGKTYTIGFYPKAKSPLLSKEYEGVEKAGVFETIGQTYWNIVLHVKVSLFYIGQIFTGDLSVSELSGPVGIASEIGDVYEKTVKVSLSATLITMLNVLANISLSLGFFNLLPLPALDGGKLIFILIEIVRGKPIDPNKENLIHVVGFFMLIALAIFIAFSDVFKIFNA